MEKQQSTSKFLCPILLTAFVVLTMLCAFLVGHSLGEKSREQEASIRAEYFEHNQTVTEFPHTMNIGGKSVNLTSIDIFERKIDHGYVGYVAITIDRSNLSDDDIYWILKGKRYNWELDADAYWWPDGTDGDIKSLHFLGCRYNSSHIYFFFYTDEQRYSLKDKKFSMSVTYLADGDDYSNQYRYSYRADFSGDLYHDSIDFLPESTVKNLLDALEDATS